MFPPCSQGLLSVILRLVGQAVGYEPLYFVYFGRCVNGAHHLLGAPEWVHVFFTFCLFCVTFDFTMKTLMVLCIYCIYYILKTPQRELLGKWFQIMN